MGHRRPSLPQGGGAQALPNFGSFLQFMHTPFDAELPNLTWWHIWGWACSRRSATHYVARFVSDSCRSFCTRRRS